MNSNHKQRLTIVIVAIHLVAVVIIGRLILFQVVEGPYWSDLGQAVHNVTVTAQPDRGIIYDRNGAVLAGNSADYQVGVSPNLITQPNELATALAPILQENRNDLLNRITADAPFVMLSGRVPIEVAEAIRALPFDGLQVDPLPRRIYPQGELLCHVLGYVDFNGVGGSGLEGYYQNELAGEAASDFRSISPLTPQRSVIAREGADLTLTIDRSLQYVVERHLNNALQEHGAAGGTIIVMDPRTGAIRAMASTPCYSPYAFYDAAESALINPAISQQYEPGSVIKLITMASALDSGVTTPQTTYYDSGILEVGGHRSFNWDRSGPGQTDMTTLLIRSLNVGAGTLALWMGPDTYYTYMERFGFGRPTGIDLMAEAPGTMHLPGSSLWTESFIATNSYGQGIAVTPLQMISSISALANGGYLMQPHLVQEIHRNGETFTHEPVVLSRPISSETADQVTAMAIQVVAQGANLAQVEGFTVAGKTGTAQIPENGVYLEDEVIGSFIGWYPADAPEVIILVKIDRPTSEPWGSLTAAPVFATIAEDIAVMLNIPPDTVRLQTDIAAAREEQE